MRRWRSFGLLLLLAMFGIQRLWADEVLDARIEHSGERFIVHSDIRIDVPADTVRAILTQYEQLPAVNSGIRKVDILIREADKVRMRVDSGVCIWFVCRDFVWVQDVSILPSGDILSVIDPIVSDFQAGRVRYRIVPDGVGARLITDADLVPGVWFPPLIGPWLIKQKLYEETLETAQSVERLATQKLLAK